jgi:DNA transformation protein
MDARTDFLAQVVERLGPFGTVTVRAVGNGQGIHLDGRLFALVLDGRLWMRADAINQAEFEAAGCEPLEPPPGKLTTLQGFFSVPDEALDSADALMPWARSAYAAALRNGPRRRANGPRVPGLRPMPSRTARGSARPAGRGRRTRHP